MPDEVVLRIVLQDQGGKVSQPSSSSTPSPSPPSQKSVVPTPSTKSKETTSGTEGVSGGIEKTLFADIYSERRILRDIVGEFSGLLLSVVSVLRYMPGAIDQAVKSLGIFKSVTEEVTGIPEAVEATKEDIAKLPEVEAVAHAERIPKVIGRREEDETAGLSPNAKRLYGALKPPIPTVEAANLPKATEEIPEVTKAGGGFAEVAAQAIPIAAGAMLAKALGDEINKKVISSIKEGIGRIGSMGTGIASANPDPAIPIRNFSESISKAGEKVSEYIPVVGYLIVATGEAGKALANFMQALDETAKRYGEYSPVIAQAQAIAEIRQTLGDFRRAQEIGPELARYIQAQADVQQRFEDIKIRLLLKILPMVTRILEMIELAVAAGEEVGALLGKLAELLGIVSKTNTELADMERENRLPDILDPTEIILGRDKEGMFKVPGGQFGSGLLE